MLILNFSHPLTPDHKVAIEVITQRPIERLIEQMAQFEVTQPFAPQVSALLDQVGFSPTEWQQTPFLLVLPALNFGAVTMLAELHGRCGFFPPVIRLSPVKGSTPPRFEVAEIINLNEVRETARGKR